MRGERLSDIRLHRLRRSPCSSTSERRGKTLGRRDSIWEGGTRSGKAAFAAVLQTLTACAGPDRLYDRGQGSNPEGILLPTTRLIPDCYGATGAIAWGIPGEGHGSTCGDPIRTPRRCCCIEQVIGRDNSGRRQIIGEFNSACFKQAPPEAGQTSASPEIFYIGRVKPAPKAPTERCPTCRLTSSCRRSMRSPRTAPFSALVRTTNRSADAE